MLEQFRWIYNFLCNTTIWCVNYVPSFILHNIHFVLQLFTKQKGKAEKENNLKKKGDLNLPDPWPI